MKVREVELYQVQVALSPIARVNPQFFGPKVRDRVPVSYWSCPMEPADTAAEELEPFGTVANFEDPMLTRGDREVPYVS